MNRIEVRSRIGNAHLGHVILKMVLMALFLLLDQWIISFTIFIPKDEIQKVQH